MPVLEASRLSEYAAALRESSLRRLRAVPTGSENWRLHDGAMSFADVAQHLIDADEWLFEKLENESLEPMVGRVGRATPETREQYEALLDDLATALDRREMMGVISCEMMIVIS